MFYISDIMNTEPVVFKSDLQKSVYETLQKTGIPFERVNTDEAISMDDCVLIDAKLNMNMVKTLFLCNRQQTEFYLFVTKGDKPFKSKDFSHGRYRPQRECVLSLSPPIIGSFTASQMRASNINVATAPMIS